MKRREPWRKPFTKVYALQDFNQPFCNRWLCKLYLTANSCSPVCWQDYQASSWIDTYSACGVGDDGCIGIYRVFHNIYPRLNTCSVEALSVSPRYLKVQVSCSSLSVLDLHQYTILDYIARRSLSSLLNVGHFYGWPPMLFLHYDSLTDYSKLPPSPPIDQVFLLDPLIATGGTACAALGMIVDWGIPGMVSLFRL